MLEIAAVLATTALYFVFYEVLDARGVFIALAVTGWTAYVALCAARDRSFLVDHGLSVRNLGPSTRAAGLVLVVGALTCLVVAVVRGSLALRPTMLVVAVLYPIWGTVQQFLVQAMFVRNVESLLPRPATVALAALLFGVIHLPDLALSAATAVLGAALTVIFLRWRSVWPLGVCHGLLGVLFYAWVLERDPWAEIVGGR